MGVSYPVLVIPVRALIFFSSYSSDSLLPLSKGIFHLSQSEGRSTRVIAPRKRFTPPPGIFFGGEHLAWGGWYLYFWFVGSVTFIQREGERGGREEDDLGLNYQ
eukprot:TRINITY_DN3410_c0_g2_i1.p3 TRINITY_DN3410_c0_g2~~TRINITY_DN3410_c0_g2_i1.p3  ORF type:complete len:104 (+),score=0.65 TRINITY_DN3410_c0_g2_i1:873-1184(+)